MARKGIELESLIMAGVKAGMATPLDIPDCREANECQNLVLIDNQTSRLVSTMHNGWLDVTSFRICWLFDTLIPSPNSPIYQSTNIPIH